MATDTRFAAMERESGLREIDPSDPTVQERYGR
jgi:hypothetical protein